MTALPKLDDFQSLPGFRWTAPEIVALGTDSPNHPLFDARCPGCDVDLDREACRCGEDYSSEAYAREWRRVHGGDGA